MPNTKSAAKALRQSLRRRAHNLARKEAYKSVLRQFKKHIAAKAFEDAKALLPKIYQALDKAAKTNAIHKNKASRLKARITKRLAAVSSSAKQNS
ncbi:30S ribosomal protein S20 [Candidatus Parcubacteria bacterium]|nr:MAG: 30S ribosomal protein S20 [Candidatus Parcubacteria bacterium]